MKLGPAAGRHGTGHSLRQDALELGFHGVPVGPAHRIGVRVHRRAVDGRAVHRRAGASDGGDITSGATSSARDWSSVANRRGISATHCRARQGPDGERAPVCHVLRALTAPPSRESTVLRLLECYIARGAIVKKSIWSCSLGWACDPIGSGSTARRVCGKLSLIGSSNNDRPVVDSPNRRQADP
jgi:hypothetical protein